MKANTSHSSDLSNGKESSAQYEGSKKSMSRHSVFEPSESTQRSKHQSDYKSVSSRHPTDQHSQQSSRHPTDLHSQ